MEAVNIFDKCISLSKLNSWKLWLFLFTFKDQNQLMNWGFQKYWGTKSLTHGIQWRRTHRKFNFSWKTIFIRVCVRNRTRCHLFWGTLSPLIKTISPTCTLRLGWTPLFQICNPLAKYCSRRHFLHEYKSACWKSPGGGRIILDFIVSNWFGIRGYNEVGSTVDYSRHFTHKST